MADTADPKPRSRRPMLIWVLFLVLALAAGGGGFFAAYSGLLFGTGDSASSQRVAPMGDIAFVAVEPVVITLPPGARSRHLRFSAQLEVERAHRQEVETLLPRVVDLLNGYLRAVDPAELEDPAALLRLRAQMLRRIQIVTGEGRVRDLLVTEFVLN